MYKFIMLSRIKYSGLSLMYKPSFFTSILTDRNYEIELKSALTYEKKNGFLIIFWKGLWLSDSLVEKVQAFQTLNNEPVK